MTVGLNIDANRTNGYNGYTYGDLAIVAKSPFLLGFLDTGSTRG